MLNLDGLLIDDGEGSDVISSVVSSRELLNQTIIENSLQSHRHITDALGKIELLGMFKQSVATELMQINERLLILKERFTELVYEPEEKPDGILTDSLQRYIDCLTLGFAQLEELFEADARKWESNL